MTINTGLKTAAIWARVSTKGQKEISPDTQIEHCRKLLQSKGYIATKIFSVDYCCLDLYACPEFQQLERMIDKKEVQAVCIYDRDRVEAQGYQRLNFIEDLKHAGIELLICNGPPVLNEPEGYALEIMYAAGKERSVIRARTGSRDGLHDRVCGTDKHSPRPASHQKVFGYDWNTDTETLTTNADYPTVRMIFDLALSGAGYTKICHELQKKGILSPRGSTWEKANVSNIIHNPVYAGRYMGLRSLIVRSNKPGYKLQHRPESEWHWIQEVKIIDPVITWEQRTALQEQIQRHIKLSSRNANRQYLLRGMIESDEHIGRQGKPIKYHGRSLPKNGYGYICEINDRQTHFISGKKLEEAVKTAINNLFESENPSFWQKMNNLEKINRPELEAELKKQQAKLAKAYQNEAKLEEGRITGQVKPEIYGLLNAKFTVQRKAIEGGLHEIQEQLDNASQIEEKIEYFGDIRAKFLKNAKSFTDVQWRELLETLDCRIRIFKQEESDLVEDFTLEPFENDEARETVRKFLEDGYDDSDSPQMTAAERFILNNKADVVSLLHKFNAIMILKGPYRVPQKIADIGLEQPLRASRCYLPYTL